ncbi:murein biosynthesis integral membrane protein MurJ [Serinibacter salmoneus]|uniref:Putative peptidoglycan lipid II flippase n=1 Tax=Serinibacter salmoneus TaxID=556530 RepID=A0A2A9CYE7_9MICO|nr:lipid II flippase MurJ [Serinibacter salmoneus]PFG19454.1 putative peptidoglycan lipid II flippase [Serinibacter salmoneus]
MPPEGGAATGGGGRLRALTSSVAGAALVITAITLVARIVGFLRWFALNAWVGPNEIGTAYGTANTIPNVLFEVAAGGALAGAVVPVVAAALAHGTRLDSSRAASALLSWTLLVLVPLGALTALAAPVFIGFLLAGQEVAADQRELAVALLRMFAVQIPLYGVAVVLSGVLQAHRRFVAPALAPLLSSLVVMTSYYLFGTLTADGVAPADLSSAAVAWLGWGTTAGVVMLVLPLVPPLWREGIRLRPGLTFPDGQGRRARSLALAGAGGLLAQQVSVVVAIRVANTAGSPDGTLTVYQSAQAVLLLPYAVLAIPVATAMFPRLSHLAAIREHGAMARESALSTRAILAIAIAGAAALAAAAVPVEALFGSVARSGSVDGLAEAVVAGSLSVVGLALMYHLSRVLLADSHSRDALVATSVGWLTVAAVAAGGALAIEPGDGVATLTLLGLAASVGTLVGGVVALVAVRRRLGGAALAGLGRTAGSGLLALTFGVLAGGALSRWLLDPASAAGAPEPLTPGVWAGIVGTLAGLLAMLLVVATLALLDRAALRRLIAARRSGSAAAPAAPEALVENDPSGASGVDTSEGRERE